MQETYTVYDILERGYKLKPLVCLHCGNIREVTYYLMMKDAHCEECGEWQRTMENDLKYL